MAIFKINCGKEDHILRIPTQKIRNEFQAKFLALLRVKLCASDIIARHKGGHWPTVIGGCHDILRVLCCKMIGMDEVSVQTVRTKLNTVKQGMIDIAIKCIPANLRDL